jgi:hypothetical protein
MERMNVSRIKETQAVQQNDTVRDSMTQDPRKTLQDRSPADVPCSCPGCFSMNF